MRRFPYQNPKLDVEARVKDLLSRMTLKEKIAQLGAMEPKRFIAKNIVVDKEFLKRCKVGIGQIGTVGRAILWTLPDEAAKIRNRLQKLLLTKTRLKIPAIMHEETLAGYLTYNSVSYPQALGLSCTFNPELLRAIGDSIRKVARANGVHQGLSPMLDISREPRWGRVEESFGEDPYLSAKLGVEVIKGLQGKSLKDGLIATPKHFAGYGASQGGRNVGTTMIPAREFREEYLFPFEAAVKEGGARSIMNSYADIDGIPCAQSRWLLTEVLRGEWGFKGFVVSDYCAIDQLWNFQYTAKDENEAGIKAFNAGLDLEFPLLKFYKGLEAGVADGRVKEADIDVSVSRHLRAKFLLGLFENPYVRTEGLNNLNIGKDRKLALRAARESLVLLKNEKHALPLSKKTKRIAVIGPNADSARNLYGDYHYFAHYNLGEEPARKWAKSILQALKEKVSRGTELLFARGCGFLENDKEGFAEAMRAGGRADVIIAVMGEYSSNAFRGISGEGCDRTETGLPGVQAELIAELKKFGKPLILVYLSGRQLALGNIEKKCDAILSAWYPADEGARAVAEVLFGEVNPSGKLTISLPKAGGQAPVHYSRKRSCRIKYIDNDALPLYPFGHGLSYTSFAYSGLKLSAKTIRRGEEFSVSFKVKNTGTRAGFETAQLYIADEVGSVVRPVKELKGFAKVKLAPGQAKSVKLTLNPEQLAFYDDKMNFVIEEGKYSVLVGSSSEDIRLKAGFSVQTTSKIARRGIFFSKPEVK